MLKFSFKICAVLTLLSSTSVFSLETDNYLTWLRELDDSGNDINGYIAQEIQVALDEANSKRYLPNCEKMTLMIAKRFKTIPPVKHPLEDWIRNNLIDKQVYPDNAWYMNESIYRYPSRFYLKNSMIAPNVRIGDFYLGTDKLSHFVSTGRRYFSHYLKKTQKGLSDLEATKSAIRFGLSQEMTILGMWPGGVFSYGDVEANYQGFTFYKRMCLDEKKPYLEQDEDGFWSLKTKPKIQDYVSGYWDETFNLSIRDAKSWSKVAPVIKELYCPILHQKNVTDRMSLYKSKKHTSFSLRYIKELQANNYEDAPVLDKSQTMEVLCSEQ